MKQVILLFLTIFLSISSSSAKSESAISIELLGPKIVMAGHRPTFDLQFKNTSNKAVTIALPLDGSLMQWRYPHIKYKLQDKNGKNVPLSPGGRCGNMNKIDIASIVKVGPNESKRTTVYWPYRQLFFRTPGTYQIVISYDSNAPNQKAWRIEGRASSKMKPGEKSKVTRLLKTVSKVSIKSKPLTVEVKPMTKKIFEKIILAYFKQEEEKEYSFVYEDFKKGKWQVKDLIQYQDNVSALVSFKPGYTPPKRPKYITENWWFTKGRYLLVGEHGNRGIKALDGFPNAGSYSVKLPAEGKKAVGRMVKYGQLKNISQLGY